MQLLAQYPISAELVTPHIGQPIAAVLPGGDVVCGVVHCIHEGHLVMRPLENVPEATVLSVKKSLSSVKLKKPKEKAQIKAWGGYPWGWGYGNFGWGLGWWWVWPLFALAALATFPFFLW